MRIYLATGLENRGWHLTEAKIRNRLTSFYALISKTVISDENFRDYVTNGKLPPLPTSMIFYKEKFTREDENAGK